MELVLDNGFSKTTSRKKKVFSYNEKWRIQEKKNEIRHPESD
jgi:hypothetical protein